MRVSFTQAYIWQELETLCRNLVPPGANILDLPLIKWSD
jgi:hypothetical protein